MASVFIQPAKKALQIVCLTIYTNRVIDGPQDFSKFPEFSTEEAKEYFEKWRKTINNTYKSLNIDEKTTGVKSLVEQATLKIKSTQEENNTSTDESSDNNKK